MDKKKKSTLFLQRFGRLSFAFFTGLLNFFSTVSFVFLLIRSTTNTPHNGTRDLITAKTFVEFAQQVCVFFFQRSCSLGC